VAKKQISIDKRSRIQINDQVYTYDDWQSYVSAEVAKNQSQTQTATDGGINQLDDSSKKFNGNIFDLTATVNGYKDAVAGAMGTIGSTLIKLDNSGTQIMNSLGTTRSRLGEFKAVYAESISKFTEMDLGDPAQVYGKISEALGKASSLGVQALTEVGATAKVIGADAGDLADRFDSVGVSIYDVGDSMKEVVNYTRSVGGNVTGVSKLVLSNLEKMNVYNFSNGVMGLTKMAAEASRLGINMDKVFAKSEELLNPENAIEMASSLQALGVANSEMLDPLRLMDMGLNGPDELMKGMKDVTKEFVQLNDKGQFEIMPGAKRRMREVAQAMGMQADEFARMALKSADFDRKLKEIRMPDFVGSEETKEMIASMAQMKDGKAVITVKDAKTGIAKEKEVDQLTPEDITNLKLSQEESAKTMEELAVDQLGVQKRILLAQEAVAERFGYSIAAAAPTQRAFDTFAGIQTQTAKETLSEGGPVDFKFLTKNFSELGVTLEQVALSLTNGKFEENLGGLVGNLDSFATEITSRMDTMFNNIKNQAQQQFQTTYGISTPTTTGGTKTQTTKPVTTTPTTTPTTLPPLTTQNKNLTEVITSSDVRVNVVVSADSSLATASVNQQELNTAITNYFKDYDNLQKIFNIDPNTGLVKGKQY